MVYLDNAATSFPKPESVIKEVEKCLSKYCGNPGRSAFGISLDASEKIYETREKISDLFNIDDPSRIVFTQNATHGLNIAIKGLIKEKCHIIISDLEHNSVIRPLYKVIKSFGGDFSVYNTDEDIEIEIERLLRDDTRVIISTIASNVTGKIINHEKLYKKAKEKGLFLILDASQYLGHIPFNYKNCPADCIIAPGHKALFGLQGSGVLIVGPNTLPDTLIEGGNGYNSNEETMPYLLPERYEAGTLSTPAIVGLCEGIKFIKDIGLDAVNAKINKLSEKTLDVLNSFNDIEVYGSGMGIISFNLNGISSSKGSEILYSYDIITRPGLHCSPLVHQKLGTLLEGAIRISYSYMNELTDVDKLYKALKKIHLYK